MVERYLQTVTAYVADNGGAPEDLTEYDECIRDMQIGAENHNETKYLRLAIDHLITYAIADAPDLMEMFYFYDEEEADELLRYIRFKVWGENFVANPQLVKKVELVDTSLTDWRKMRDKA